MKRIFILIGLIIICYVIVGANDRVVERASEASEERINNNIMWRNDMIEFRYNETDSKLKHREVYYLYYKDKLYYSKPLLIPVKLEINRDEREILLNNLIIDSDKQICIDIFELIVSMKQILNIENYLISNYVKSGELYRQIYKKDII